MRATDSAYARAAAGPAAAPGAGPPGGAGAGGAVVAVVIPSVGSISGVPGFRVVSFGTGQVAGVSRGGSRW
ncbi:hypothetical protein GCM10010424_48840 [Streptomyces lienomycini]